MKKFYFPKRRYIPVVLPATITKAMRITAFLLFVCAMNVHARTYSQDRLTLNLKNVKLSQVFSIIQQKTEYQFLYNTEDVQQAPTVSISVKRATVPEILADCFENSPLGYRIENKTVVVVKKISAIPLSHSKVNSFSTFESYGILASSLSNQLSAPEKIQKVEFVVKGKVTDENGTPLAGVSVTLKGSNTVGTTTNENGDYSISTGNGNGSLIFSSIGFETQEMKIEARNLIDVVLHHAASSLEQVVLVGYGTQKKKDLTGAVSSINSDDVRNLPVPSPTQAMQGKIAGVQVTMSSGSPGSVGVVHIRGIGSINGSNTPLYIVDGLPQDDISWLPASAIQTLDVLKDASSAAIYGARAANGVILITTKSGKLEQPLRTTLNTYVGFQYPWKRPYSLNARDFIQYKITALEAVGQPLPVELSTEENINQVLDFVKRSSGSVNGTDWWKEVTDYGALMQDYNIGISGGGKNATYNSNFDYINQDGIIKGTNYNRFSWQNSLGVNIGSRIKFNGRINLTYEQRKTTGEQNPWSGMVFLTMAVDPITPVFRNNLTSIPTFYNRIMDGYESNNPFSQYAGPLYNNKYNPVGLVERDEQNKWENLGVRGGADLSLRIIQPLIFKSSIGVDLGRSVSRNFIPEYHLNAFDLSNLSSVYNGMSRVNYYVWENTLSYDQIFGDHHIQALAGTAAELTKGYSFAGSVQDLPENNPTMRILSAGRQNPAVSGGEYSTSLESFFGRINYSYKDKYIITGNVRRDGSSNFADGRKWGTFPSVAVAWRLSKESFVQDADLSWLDDAKIRLSYGEIGNQNVTSGAYLTTFGNTTRYAFGDPSVAYLGRGRTTVGNPLLQWETSKEFDVGIDLSMFEQRIFLTADFFNKNISSMLLQVPLPSVLGYPNFPWVNAGDMRNRGWEVALTYQNKDEEFRYSISGNISAYRNKVTSLGGGGAIFTAGHLGEDLTITQMGSPVGSFYGWKADGLFQTQEEVDKSAQKGASQPGDIKYVDLNGDGILNSDDRTIIGNPWPNFTYGLTFNSNYKNFDLSIFFQGSQGNDVLDILRYDIEGGTSNYNAPRGYLQAAWNGQGSTNKVYKISANSGLNQNVSSYFLEKGSYLRLKNLQIGYNFSKEVLERWRIPQLRIYVGIQNLFTITKYSGLDPEIGATSNGANNLIVGDPKLQGIDQGVYPQPRIFMFGINATF